MRARVAGGESLRPMSPSSVVLSPSSAVGLMMRAPRFTNCRVERVRRASRVGRGEEMRGCDDCREPEEGERERRPPRLPPRVKRARLLSETTNRILTSIHVMSCTCVFVCARRLAAAVYAGTGGRESRICFRARRSPLNKAKYVNAVSVSPTRSPFPRRPSLTLSFHLPYPCRSSNVRNHPKREIKQTLNGTERERPRLRRVNRLLVLPPDRR